MTCDKKIFQDFLKYFFFLHFARIITFLEHKTEFGTFQVNAFHGDIFVMSLQNMLYNGQSQAGSAFSSASAGFHSVKSFKNSWKNLSFYSHSIVNHLNKNLIFKNACFYHYFCFLSVGIMNGI